MCLVVGVACSYWRLQIRCVRSFPSSTCQLSSEVPCAEIDQLNSTLYWCVHTIILTHCCLIVLASKSGQDWSSVDPDWLEIPVIPATLVTNALPEGREGVVETGWCLGEGEELRCRLGGRLSVGGLTRCFVRLESWSEVPIDCTYTQMYKPWATVVANTTIHS